MDPATPVITGIGLSMDCLAVSLAIGAGPGVNRVRTGLLVGFSFGFFQFVMPVIGFLGGNSFTGMISSYSPIAAFLILLVIGVKMIAEAVTETGEEVEPGHLTLTRVLVLSVVTSIDALGVGISFAFAGIDMYLTAVSIGLIAFCFSFFGVMLGKSLSEAFGRGVEVLGGVILIGIGCRFLLEMYGFL